MKLLNEIIEESFNNPISGISGLIAFDMLPLDYVLPFKVGQEIFIDDFEVSKFRRLTVMDEFIKKEKRICSLLSNANRRGVVLSIDKKKQARNSGKIKFLSINIWVKLYDGDIGCLGDEFLIVSNPNFLKRVF